LKMKIKLPRVGETVDEVYLVSWSKVLGEVISIGDSLMEVETDKATVVIPSPVAGILVEYCFSPGDEIKTGEVVAICEGN